MNGIVVIPKGLTITYNGNKVSTKKVVKSIKMKKGSTVHITFNSQYESIIPNDDCIRVKASSLKQLLRSFSLLMYKRACIHRKGVLTV